MPAETRAGALNSLPLPVAALCRRANNEKSAKARHDTAYFAWEASVRLAVAARPPENPERLRVPSVGAWVRAMNAGETILKRADLLAAYTLFTEVGTGKSSRPRSLTARRFIDALPAYRNQVIGHGATRSSQFYDRAYEHLMAALPQAWEQHLFWPDNTGLVYVESVTVTGSGSREGRVFDLTGQAATVEARGHTPVPDPVLPRRIYARTDGRYRSLHPWLLFEQSELGERVWFFNGRKRRAQYLDYKSGASLRGAELARGFPDVERDLDAVLAQSGEARDEPETDEDPHLYGEYRILDKLGEGGMGVVYRAQHESLERLVALKTLPANAADDAVALARFKREIASLARCEHPNVVKILSSGWAHGAHYYTMELVDGEDLTSANITGDDRVRRVARLFRDAALGVQHLHDQGIIHRDIKPANLMLTRPDSSTGPARSDFRSDFRSERRIVVMDLGLAALGDASASITRDRSAILGTLRYMPPEQLQRNLLALDRRADIYSLGATLYEVLCTQPMFDGDSEARLMQQVLHEDPPDLRSIDPTLPADLAVIVSKAVSKDPRQRYDSAGAMAADLDAWANGQAISARPPTLTYVLKLAIRRNKAMAVTALIAIAALVVGAALFLERERTLRRAADRHAARADREAELARANAYEAMRGATRTRNAVRLASAREQQFDPTLVLALVRETEPDDTPPRWHGLARAALTQDLAEAVLTGHLGNIDSAAFSPDGTRVVTASADHTAQVWRADGSGAPVHLRGHGDRVTSAVFSPDGTRVVTASLDMTARVWNADGSGRPVYLAGHRQQLNSAEFSPDGARVVTSSSDKSARVWNADGSGAPILLTGHRDSVIDAHFSGDGTRVVTASVDRSARVWTLDGATPPVPLLGHGAVITAAAFSPDGTRVVTASWDETARVFRADGTGAAIVLTGHQGPIMSAAFSPDGTRVVTASWDDTARVWSADGTGAALVLTGHQQNLESAVFSADGRRILTASSDHTARIWNADGSGEPTVFVGHRDKLTGACFSPDGTRVVTSSWDRTARVWRVERRGRPVRLIGHVNAVTSVDVSPDGTRVVTGSMDQTARVWPIDGRGPPVLLLGHRGPVNAAHFSPDGTRVVTASWDGTARVWRADGSGEPAVLRGHSALVFAAAFSPDGSRIATGSMDKSVRVWRADDAGMYRSESTLEGHRDAVMALAFSPDGSTIATSSLDRGVRLWQLGAGGRFHGAGALPEHPKQVQSVAFSPDGKFIVTSCFDRTVRVWNADGTGAPMELTGDDPLMVAESTGGGALFSPDGSRILALFDAQPLRLWPADGRGQPVDLPVADLSAFAAAFSPDGTRIVTASHSGRDPATGEMAYWATVWSDFAHFSGPDDPILWTATSYCPTVEVRTELLGVPPDMAAEHLAQCQARVAAARAQRR